MPRHNCFVVRKLDKKPSTPQIEIRSNEVFDVVEYGGCLRKLIEPTICFVPIVQPVNVHRIGYVIDHVHELILQFFDRMIIEYKQIL